MKLDHKHTPKPHPTVWAEWSPFVNRLFGVYAIIIIIIFLLTTTLMIHWFCFHCFEPPMAHRKFQFTMRKKKMSLVS